MHPTTKLGALSKRDQKWFFLFSYIYLIIPITGSGIYQSKISLIVSYLLKWNEKSVEAVFS